MENLNIVINEIKEKVNATGVHGSSRKDEIKVMKALLNDTDFEVNTGGKEAYSPARDIRDTMSKIVSSTTKMPKAEASEHLNNYEFNNSDAQTMVNVAKEFMNSYLDTERKIAFGEREDRNISIMGMPKQESERTYPAKNEDGTYTKKTVKVPAHMGIKASAKVPSSLK